MYMEDDTSAIGTMEQLKREAFDVDSIVFI